MKRLHGLVVVALLVAGAAPAAGQGVTLEFQDGKVRLSAQNASVSQILAEWARRGRTTIVNGERIPGAPVTLELQNVTEHEALDVVLRGVSGYLVGARENAVNGASAFDRIYILPTSSRPTNAAPLQQQPQQALQVQDNFDDDEPPLPAGARGPNPNPAARLPRDLVQPGPAGRNPAVVVDDDRPEPETRPAQPPANPFGVAPGTTRPGVINQTPGGQNRPNQ